MELANDTLASRTSRAQVARFLRCPEAEGLPDIRVNPIERQAENTTLKSQDLTLREVNGTIDERIRAIIGIGRPTRDTGLGLPVFPL